MYSRMTQPRRLLVLALTTKDDFIIIPFFYDANFCAIFELSNNLAIWGGSHI